MAKKRPAAAAFGVLSPLPAGIWNVRCCPGPDYNGCPRDVEWGTVLDPVSVVNDWCAGTAGASSVGGPCPRLSTEEGAHLLGGWFLSRSAAVQWDGCDEVYFYRCGDKKRYDLSWQRPDDFIFDADAYYDAEKARDNLNKSCRKVARTLSEESMPRGKIKPEIVD